MTAASGRSSRRGSCALAAAHSSADEAASLQVLRSTTKTHITARHQLAPCGLRPGAPLWGVVRCCRKRLLHLPYGNVELQRMEYPNTYKSQSCGDDICCSVGPNRSLNCTRHSACSSDALPLHTLQTAGNSAVHRTQPKNPSISPNAIRHQAGSEALLAKRTEIQKADSILTRQPPGAWSPHQRTCRPRRSKEAAALFGTTAVGRCRSREPSAP